MINVDPVSKMASCPLPTPLKRPNPPRNPIFPERNGRLKTSPNGGRDGANRRPNQRKPMHEINLVHALMSKIQRIVPDKNQFKVAVVKVRLGTMAPISGKHLREHFTEATLGTVAEGAELEIVQLNALDDPLAEEVILESLEIENR
jgi:hydrogenase nickel incorporation protein HypA/HybF